MNKKRVGSERQTNPDPTGSRRAGEGRRIVVTGGAGQFGMLVLRRLVDDPAVSSVVSLDLRPPRLIHDKIEAAEADVRDPGIKRHLEGCDALVHLAFAIHCYKPRELFDGINVEGSKNVFRAALEAGARQVVYASSVAAYGIVHGHPQPIREDSPRVYQPEFSYARAKYEVEDFLDDFEREHPDLVITRLRPVVMAGERMESLMGEVLKHRIIPTTSGAPFPIVWDEDVADAVALALQKRARGAFNLSADDTLTAKQLAAAVGMRTLRCPRWLGVAWARVSPLAARLGIGSMVDPEWIRTSDVPMVLASDKARTQLGWTPRCDTAVEVMRHFDRTVPRQLDRRIADAVKRLADSPPSPDSPDLSEVDFEVHLHLTGPHGGDFILAADAGRLTVRSGMPWPVAAAVHLDAGTFTELVAGRREWPAALQAGEITVEGPEQTAAVVRATVAELHIR